jgi:hypothetical protein
MADVQVSFVRDTDANVVSYTVFFALNGGPQQSLSVPRTAAADAAGYQVNYSSLTPTPPALVNGDVVGIPGVESVDSYGQASPMIACVPPSITISIAPPPPAGPTAVTAAQV